MTNERKQKRIATLKLAIVRLAGTNDANKRQQLNRSHRELIWLRTGTYFAPQG